SRIVLNKRRQFPGHGRRYRPVAQRRHQTVERCPPPARFSQSRRGVLKAMTNNPHGLEGTDLLRRHGYVAGSWIPAGNGALLDVRNPATGELLAQVPLCGAAETQRAIQAADHALPGWKQSPAAERSRLL